MSDSPPYDFVIVGSGFGGSVSALRLVEKGYRVLMLERGRRLTAEDFPKSNWDLRRWLWMPWLGCRGLFKMTFMRHVTVLSGVGVGGGSWSTATPCRSLLQPFSRRLLGSIWRTGKTNSRRITIRPVACWVPP